MVIAANASHPRGRTVRDIVEDAPETVSDAWSRSIVLQVLRSIETQQAMQMPHRIIMPDTIVVYDDGFAELLPSPNSNPDYQPTQAVDLKALAAVIHFAITKELLPQPLAGRDFPGYSAALLNAIDRCLWGERSQRPQTVNELRALLAEEPVPPAEQEALPEPVAEPAPLQLVRESQPEAVAAASYGPAPDTAPPGKEASPRSGRPAGRGLLLAAVALAAIGAAALGGYQAGRAERAREVAANLAVDTAPAATLREAPAAPSDPANLVTLPPENANGAAPAPQAADAPTSAAASAEPASTQVAGTIYKLDIKPWGTVYVDGAERGVSPPMKFLKLPPGAREVRIENPAFPPRVMKLNAGRNKWGTIAHTFR